MSSDIDNNPALDYNAIGDMAGLESQMRSTDNVIYSEKDKLLKYCIAASVILHLLLFAGVSRVPELAPTKAFLRPGEKVSQVRLVEQENKEPKSQVPPDNATAVSDRDHIALRERIPKRPPSSASSLGKIEPVEKRIAALIPPQAPEDLSRPNEEKKTKDDRSKIPHDDKPPVHNKLKTKAPTESRQKQQDASHRKLDLKPTQQEQEIATGLASPGGPTDFFPDGDLEEAVVDINTREEKFFSYLLHLKRKIQGVWVYPSSAANLGLGGTLTVEFSIARDGELLYVNLLDTSGHSILDESAVKAIQNAAPYFPFPSRMRAKRLKIRANFIYITSNYFRRIM
jgi:periplasmic protein TonB